MITNREIASSIIRGRNFYSELIPLIESGVVSKAALDQVCEKYHIHVHTLDSFLLTGILVAHNMSKYTPERDSALIFEPECYYLVYISEPVNDSLCFYTASVTSFLNRIDAYERFCRLHYQTESKHCKRCDLILPPANSGEYCGEKCKELSEKQSANSTSKTANLEAAFEQLFRSIRDFFTIS
jgi:hypothetical protein